MLQSVLIRSSMHNQCADCNAPKPTWYNFNQGVFVCVQCAGVHRGLPNQGVRVKSVDLDNWTEEEVREMEMSCSNEIVNERLEKFLPVYFPKQGEATPPDLRREFITHKYLRGTFCTHASFLKYGPASGRMEGLLEKKGKDKSMWKPRYFVLSPLSIEYYLEFGQTEPKSCLSLSQVELHLERCVRERSCLVLTHLSHAGVSGRKYYLRGEPSQLFDWYFALLTAKAASDSVTISNSVRVEAKNGNLYKVGGQSYNCWKLRWFSLNGSHITYSVDKLSALPQGDFNLGPASKGYRVEAGVSHKIRSPTRFTFQVVTPDRTYKLCAKSGEERDSWMETFSSVIVAQSDY